MDVQLCLKNQNSLEASGCSGGAAADSGEDGSTVEELCGVSASSLRTKNWLRC